MSFNESKREEKKNRINEENLTISDILNVISSRGRLQDIYRLSQTNYLDIE